MKIIVIGGTGTIGKAVVAELSQRHKVIPVGQSKTEFTVNINDSNSIEKMYKEIGSFDALVSTVGKVHFAPFTEMTTENYYVGIHDKLMGQINLVLIGLKYINEGGSFTLTSGILNRDPIRLGTSASMVNAAIDGFVKAAAIEMPRGIRINCVSPSVIQEAMDQYGEYFRGFEPVPAARAALAFSKSVEGAQTGQVYFV